MQRRKERDTIRERGKEGRGGQNESKKAKQHAIRIEKKSMSQGDKAHTSDGRSLRCHSFFWLASQVFVTRRLKSMNSKRAKVRGKTRVNFTWHVPDIEFKWFLCRRRRRRRSRPMIDSEHRRRTAGPSIIPDGFLSGPRLDHRGYSGNESFSATVTVVRLLPERSLVDQWSSPESIWSSNPLQNNKERES